MLKILRKIVAFIFILTAFPAFSQGKYFEVVAEKSTYGGGLMGKVQPLNSQYYVTLSYKGKTQSQLLKAVQQYLKNRPALKLDHIDTTSDGKFLVYRDFATIGSKEKCFADLAGLTYIYVIPEKDGTIKLNLGLTSKIFASIFDAKLRISPGDDVMSDNDEPFNVYEIVQPADEGVLTSNVWLGTRTRKRELKSAYPDSVFDPGGKVVNPVNKKLIEEFYDGYITDIKTFLDGNLK